MPQRLLGRYPNVARRATLYYSTASALHEPFVIPSQMPAQEVTRSFDPKDPPKLNPPKDDPISVEELAKCDGMRFQIAILRPGEQQLIDQTMQALARIILRM